MNEDIFPEYCADFYDSPSEFDTELSELKAALMKSVKREFLDRMSALERENAALREFRDEKARYDSQLASIKREYVKKSESAKRDAEHERANAIVRSLCVIGYRPKPIYTERPKCNRCDERRRIAYVSPMGRKCVEDCECAKEDIHYEPTEEPMLRFCVRRDGLGDIFYRREDGRETDSYSLIADVYIRAPEKLEEVNEYRAVFVNESDCKSYCDWKNDKIKEAKNA